MPIERTGREAAAKGAFFGKLKIPFNDVLFSAAIRLAGFYND